MKRLSGLIVLKIVTVAAIGCMHASPGSAGVQDSVFFASPDGNSIAFDVREVARREVLDRLLANRAIELEWVDTGFGEEKITGVYKGSADAVLQRLLAQTDFVVVYDGKGEKSRISRLIIVGKASSHTRQAALPTLPGLTTGTPPAPPSDQALRPFSAPADFRPPTAAELATPVITPPPPGMVAPPLVPPSPSEAALPLWVPPTTTTR